MKGYFVLGIIFAAIFLIIGICYLINSIRQYGTWKIPTIVCVLFAGLGAFCTIGLINDSHKQKESSTSIETATTGHINEPNAMQQLNADQQESNKEEQVLKELQTDYQKLGNVTLDQQRKTYFIHITDGNTKKAIQYVVNNPEKANDVGYTKLTDSFNQVSKNVSKVLGKDFTVSMPNPSNESQILYSVTNGNVTNDFVNNKK